MTADNFLLSDTHHDESTVCQLKSILIHVNANNFNTAPMTTYGTSALGQTVSDRGTGQGSVISPLLANVYL